MLSIRPRIAFLAVVFAAGLTSPRAASQVTVQRYQKTKDFDHYQINVPDHSPQLRVTVTHQSGPPSADIYLKKGAKPTTTDYDARAATPSGDEELVLNALSTPALSSGVWHIGVLHHPTTNYNILFKNEAAPSVHDGLGANRFDGAAGDGVSFRVWAPFANAVNLAGSFNNWSATNAPMASEGDGNWSLDVRGLGAGAEYKYVVKNGSSTLWKNDPRARKLTSSVGVSVVVDPDAFDWTGPAFGSPTWNDMVVYEMHVGTLFDTPGGGPGSFATAQTRLDYLKDLGVNVIEVMPIHEFPGDFSWGYNPSYPFSVETAYGGPDAFKTFVREAHARGIAVVLDVIYNHWGPTDLDLWQFDGWSQGGWGGIYFYNSVLAQTPWGDTRPDYGRPEVRQYVRDNALSWLDEYRVDGLRWDSTSYMRKGPFGDIAEAWSLMQWSNDEIDATAPWKINIAEDMYDAPNEWITKTTGAGGAGFDAQWDATFVHPIRTAIITPDDNARNMWSVRDAIARKYNGDAFERVIYTESHDEVANGKSRVPEEIWPGNAGSYYSKKRSLLGAACAFTAPGIPMLFQGQELLEDGYFQDTDPVDWSKLSTYAGIHQAYKDMIALRRNFAGATRGLMGQHLNVHHVNDNDKVIAFHRFDQGGPGDDVIVLMNFANKAWNAYTIGLPRGGLWKVRFNSDWSGYDSGFGNHPTNDVTAAAASYDGMGYSASLSFGPYTAVILSQ